MKDPKGKLARWVLNLQPYDFEVIYKSGKKHLDADALSRNPVFPPPDVEDDSFGLGEKLALLDGDNSHTIVAAQRKDKKLLKIIQAVEEISRTNKPPKDIIDDPNADFELKDGVLYKFNGDEFGRPRLLCIPDTMRVEVLQEAHVQSLHHLGFDKTYAFLRSRYFWPKMYTHTVRFVRACQKCQIFNRRNCSAAGPLQPVAPPPEPFHRIGIDYQGPFPLTTPCKNRYVFVAIDHLTRFTVAYPVRDADAKSAIAVIEKHIIWNHRCPKEILADRGSCFVSSEFRDFCDKYHIRLLYTAAYKPDSNGVCERRNDVLKSTLAKHVNEYHTNWDHFVHIAAFSSNIATHRVTGFSPYSLLYQREPFLPCDAAKPTCIEIVEPVALRTRQRQTLRLARLRTISFQKKCKLAYDKKHKPLEFSPGEKVLLANYAPKPGLVQKWIPKWIGPFVIVRRTAVNNYEVRDLREIQGLRRPLRIVSVRHLKRYYDVYSPSVDASEDESNFHSAEEELESFCSIPISSIDGPSIIPETSTNISSSIPEDSGQASTVPEDLSESVITPTSFHTVSEDPTSSLESPQESSSVSSIVESLNISVEAEPVDIEAESVSTAPESLSSSEISSDPSSFESAKSVVSVVNTLRRSSRVSKPPDKYDPSKY